MLPGPPNRYHVQVQRPCASEETAYRIRRVWGKTPSTADYEHYVDRAFLEAGEIAVSPRIQWGPTVVQYEVKPIGAHNFPEHGAGRTSRPVRAGKDAARESAEHLDERRRVRRSSSIRECVAHSSVKNQ